MPEHAPRWFTLAAAVTLAFGTVVTGCKPKHSGPTPRPQSLTPLGGHQPIEVVNLPRGGTAQVAVPLGAARPQRITVVLEQSSEDLATRCSVWQRTVPAKGFFLCLPVAINGAPNWTTTAALENDLRGALTTIRQRFGNYTAPDGVTLAATGQVAQLVVGLVRAEPAFFSRLLFVDGGFDAWRPSDSARFGSLGGRAVVGACSRSECRDQLMQLAGTLRAAGVDTQVLLPTTSEQPAFTLLGVSAKLAGWLETAGASASRGVGSANPKPGRR